MSFTFTFPPGGRTIEADRIVQCVHAIRGVSEMERTSSRFGWRRFGMKTLLALPIMVGLGIFVADFLVARFFTARQPVAVQFMAVDAETGDPVANATLTLVRGDRQPLVLDMGYVSNIQIHDFGINRRLDSRMRGSGWTDYGGWSVQVTAEGHQAWKASLADLTKDNSAFQNTNHALVIARLQRKPKSMGHRGDGGGWSR